MTNRDVARILRVTAQLLEVDGALIGRYRSYERAAQQATNQLWRSVADLACSRCSPIALM